MSKVAVVAPIPGDIIPLADVPDPAFANGSVGAGFGIAKPRSGPVLAPVSGTVMMVAGTRHAVGIKTESGLQFLLHLGIDTVELGGAPFTITVAKGDEVTAGQPIGTIDVAAIEAAGKETTSILAITNSKKKLDTLDVTYGPATPGTEIAQATAKQAAPAPQADETAGMDKFDALGYRIVKLVGGEENIRSVTHCITRVRFYLNDESKAADAEIRDLDGVIDVVKSGGQYQVVIGPDVEDVYGAVTKQLSAETLGAAEEVAKPRPTGVLGWAKWGFSELIGVITGSMIPIIGLLAASGIIKGILSLMKTFNLVTGDSPTYAIIDAMSDSVFYFLPIFVGFTAAKRLGSDPIIVAIIGGVLVHPQVRAWLDPELNPKADDFFNTDFFGIPYHLASYTYSIFPIIVAAWIAAKIEPWLKRVIPNTIRMIFLPLAEVVIVSLAILLLLGPVITFISQGIAGGVNGLFSLSHPIAGLLIGGFYQCLVIFGLHWAVIPIVAQQIADPGYSPLNAIISVTMVAQGGAVLAVFAKSRVLKIKELAGSAAIAAFAGITEPAMYGINLKYGRIFAMGCIGSAVGGLITGLMKVNMWGFTGSLIGFSSFVNPDGHLDNSWWGFWIGSLVSLVVAFVLTYFFGFKDSDFESGREVKKVQLGSREPKA